MKKILASLLLTVAAAAQAGTGLINVQFSGTFTYAPNGDPTSPPQVGAAVIGSAGDYWNSYAAAALDDQALLDSSGAVTGAKLSFTSQGAYTSQDDFSAFYGTPTANLMRSYLYDENDGSAIQATFSGLSAGRAYDLYVYTQGDFYSAYRSISFSVNGGAVQTSDQTNASTFILNDNYLLFHVVADSSGVINIVETGFGGEGNLNGFQLLAAPVPEPSSGLMLLGGLGLLAAGLRRSHTASGSARNKSCAAASCPDAL